MKGLRFLIVLVLIALALVSWVRVGQRSAERVNTINSLKSQIAHYEEINAPKSEIELYKKLISLDGSMENRLGLADAYYRLGQAKNYAKECEKIISAYPDDKTGYVKLMNYYDEKNKPSEVFSLYNSIPNEIKNDPEIQTVYSKYEYSYITRRLGLVSIGNYYNGLAVCLFEGKYGFVNLDGNSQIPQMFDMAYPFSDKLAAVLKDGEWYYIDTAGDKVSGTTEHVSELYSPINNYSAAEIDGKWGFIKANAFSKFAFDYERTTNLRNGVAAVKTGGKWYLINSSLEKIIPDAFDDVILDETMSCCCGGLIFAKVNGKYALYNAQGQQIASGFDDAHCFVDGFAAVQRNGKWGFINTSGEVVIDFKFDDADSFCLDLAPVRIGEKWHYIKTNGETAFDEEFDYANRLSSNGRTSVILDEKCYLLIFNKYNLN